MTGTSKSLIVTLMAAGFLAVQTPPAFAAVTLSGTAPVSRSPLVIIQPHNQSVARGVVKFKFSAPTAGAYTMGFCIGPAANPCGMATSYVVQVPGGQERMAVVDASIFEKNVLAVGQGTSQALPFTITME